MGERGRGRGKGRREEPEKKKEKKEEKKEKRNADVLRAALNRMTSRGNDVRGTAIDWRHVSGVLSDPRELPASTPRALERSSLFSPGEALSSPRALLANDFFSRCFLSFCEKIDSPLERPGSNLDDSGAQLAKKAP